MTRYTNFKMRISEGQKGKFKKAFESNCDSTTIRLTFSDLHGEYVIALTNSQLDKIEVNVFIGDIAEQYLRKFVSVSGADKTFGLRNKDGKFYIGNKEARIRKTI